MKGTLKKELPLADIGDEVEYFETTTEIRKKGVCIAYLHKNLLSEWIDITLEKKRYEDLKEGDYCFLINQWGDPVRLPFAKGVCRSETFLTREEAEDEHRRREYAVRPDRFIPKKGEVYFMPCEDGKISEEISLGYCFDILTINSGLAFRTHEDCEKAIKEHDLVRLFYTIR